MRPMTMLIRLAPMIPRMEPRAAPSSVFSESLRIRISARSMTSPSAALNENVRRKIGAKGADEVPAYQDCRE